MLIEEAFLSLFNGLLGCTLPNENLVNQKDSRLLIYIPVIPREKKNYKGRKKMPTNPWTGSNALSDEECVCLFMHWVPGDVFQILVFDLLSLDHVDSLYLL